MKAVSKLIKFTLTLCVGVAIGAITMASVNPIKQNQKDYEAACVLSDICRCALDHPELDHTSFEEIYWDFILNVDTYTDAVTWEEIHNDYCGTY